MKMRSLLFVWLVLLSSISMFAQSSGASADPLTGTWKVEDGSGGLALKFDGKGVVSGLVNPSSSSPGEIKTGTFDPKTGALKLEGEIDRKSTRLNSSHC